MKLNYIDVFSGCGGLSEGFSRTNKFKGLAHIEWEKPMVDTLRHRLITSYGYSYKSAQRAAIWFDLRQFNPLVFGGWSGELRRLYHDNDNQIMESGLDGLVSSFEVDVIIGGPPCQSYSIAGRAQDSRGMQDDYRNYLFESFVSLVDHYKPKLFVFENVPGMLSAMPGGVKITERIYKAFQEIGYTTPYPDGLKKCIFRASDYGVPQDRDRVIIFGVKNDSACELDRVYKALRSSVAMSKFTVADAIGHLPKLYPLLEAHKIGRKNISHCQIEGPLISRHEPRYHNADDIRIFSEWLDQDMNRKSTKAKIDFYNSRKKKAAKHAKYRNLEWDRPSPTVVAHLYKDGLMFIHPDKKQARSITIREAALLQSFPNDFEFIGSTSHCFKMIGNAVPPLFSEAIANAIYSILGDSS